MVATSSGVRIRLWTATRVARTPSAVARGGATKAGGPVKRPTNHSSTRLMTPVSRALIVPWAMAGGQAARPWWRLANRAQPPISRKPKAMWTRLDFIRRWIMAPPRLSKRPTLVAWKGGGKAFPPSNPFACKGAKVVRGGNRRGGSGGGPMGSRWGPDAAEGGQGGRPLGGGFGVWAIRPDEYV